MEENMEKEQRKGKKKWLVLLVLLLLLASCTAWQLMKDQDALALDPDQSEGTLDGLRHRQRDPAD